MLYPFMTYIDGTDIVYSDIFHKENDTTDYVRVFFERINKDGSGFDSMDCTLPGGPMENVVGFTADEVANHHRKILKMAPILIASAKEEVSKIA